MASGSDDKTVKLWDLRKLKCLKTLTGEAPFNCVSFDHSGTFLATGSDTVRVLDVRKWRTLVTLSESTKAVHGVSLSHDAQVCGRVGNCVYRNLLGHSMCLGK